MGAWAATNCRDQKWNSESATMGAWAIQWLVIGTRGATEAPSPATSRP